MIVQHGIQTSKQYVQFLISKKRYLFQNMESIAVSLKISVLLTKKK